MFFKPNKKIGYALTLLIASFIFSSPLQAAVSKKKIPSLQKIIIVGGGHLGLIEAYSTYVESKKTGEDIVVEIYEKNKSIQDTTAANIWNSHTPDEIAAVVPRGQQLAEKLAIPFDKPGGIRVQDVPGANDSPSAKRFIEHVKIDGQNTLAFEKRTNALLALGKAGMAMWKHLYQTADPQLKAVFKESNFNPCCEVAEDNKGKLHKGYRIDLIYDVSDAKAHAASMMKSYQDLGFQNCQFLSPDEVIARDPSLAKFCALHSAVDKAGKRQWKEDSMALWRPGGCLDTQTFLPKFAAYLKKVMGKYRDKNGVQKDRFQLHLNKKVTGIIYGNEEPQHVIINGLNFEDGSHINTQDINATYVFCPGEAVGTLEKLGFNEPAYAGFAGASLCLTVPVTSKQLKHFETLNHCMEVHKVGVVLAWQARIRDGKIFLGGAGTKAFYGDKQPTINQAFAKNRNLLQLQMFNDVLPQVVSIALDRDTTSQNLTEKDMAYLEEKGIAKRWVGRRSVVYDGFPTLGHLYHHGKVVTNARVTTHLGSGGGSFALIASLISSCSLNPAAAQKELSALNLSPEFVKNVLDFADSRRNAVVQEN